MVDQPLSWLGALRLFIWAGIAGFGWHFGSAVLTTLAKRLLKLLEPGP